MRVGAIDQGTTSTRIFIADDHGHAEIDHAVRHNQHRPAAGLVEQNPDELMANVHACIEAAGALDAIALAKGVVHEVLGQVVSLGGRFRSPPFCEARQRRQRVNKRGALSGTGSIADEVAKPIPAYAIEPHEPHLPDRIITIKRRVDPATTTSDQRQPGTEETHAATQIRAHRT